MPVNRIERVHPRASEQLSVTSGVMIIELPPEKDDHAS
jgi:hypothetical protein